MADDVSPGAGATPANPPNPPTIDDDAAAAVVLPDRATIEAGALAMLADGRFLLAVDPATKAPMHAAQDFLEGRRNLSPADVRRHAAAGAVFGVALGPSGLAVLDLDAPTPPADGILAGCFDGSHVTRSRKGWHAWYVRPEGMPAGRKIKPLPDADILAGGYCIAWEGDVPTPAELPAAVLDFILTDPPTSSSTPMSSSTTDPRGARLAVRDADDVRAFLAAECAAVEGKGEGARNSRLNLATFRVARREHLAPGIEGEARAALELAGVASGLPLAEVRRTVAGAWERGRRAPYLPRPRPGWITGDDDAAAEAAPEGPAPPATWGGWHAAADAFVVESVPNPAARERDRRLVEVGARLAAADGTFAIGSRVLGQRAGLSPASAARGARHVVELGLWEVVAAADFDILTGKRVPTRYRLAKAFGEGETLGHGPPTGDVSPAAKSLPTALRVGCGKLHDAGPAYLSTRWRTWAALRDALDGGRRLAAADIAAMLGTARRTVADHLAYFQERGVLDRAEEATGGRPRALWTLATDAARAVARLAEWGRATLDRRWKAAVAAWAALRFWTGKAPPDRRQAGGLAIDRFAAMHGAVVSAVTP